MNPTTKYYCIYVTPANKNFPPHVWNEGGLYTTERLANQYAAQLRKNKQEYDGRKNFYTKVEVILSTDERVITPKPYHKDDDLNQFRDIVKRSKTITEACGGIRKIHDVPKDISRKFFETYGVNGSRSPEDAVTKMYYEVHGINIKAYEAMKLEAKADKQWAIAKEKEVGREWTEASDVSREMLCNKLDKSVEQLTYEKYRYFKMRAFANGKAYGDNWPIDPAARGKWERITGEKIT